MTKYLNKDQTPVPEGHCVMPDHYVTTFTVTIRTLRSVTDDLKDLIQRRYEVVNMEKTDEVCVVK